MTHAGWYPDPAGRPHTYRYWDGRAWSEQTTGDPYAPPPGAPTPPPPPPPPPPPTPPAPAAPPGYGGYGGYGHAPAPPYPGAPAGPAGPGGATKPGGAGKVIALVVAAVVGIVLLGVVGFFGVRALTDDDGSSDADSSATTDATEAEPTDDASPTETGTEDPTEGAGPTTLQCSGGSPAITPDQIRGGRIQGGGLAQPVQQGYQTDELQGLAFTFADTFATQSRVIERSGDTGWISLYGVGGLRKSNGFESPEQAAEVVMQCMTASDSIYSGFTGRTDLASEAVTVDGAEGWSITSEIRIDDPDLSVEGDVGQVVVVDTGDPDHFGLYISVVPLGDQELIDLQERAFQQLSVG